MKLNKILLAALFTVLATSTHAAEQKTSKAKAVKPAAAASVKATAPVAFGAVKLGMTKAQVEALTEKDSFYLAMPLTPYVYSKGSTPVEGDDKFDGNLVTPYNAEPIPLTLTFKNDLLTSINIDLDKQEKLADNLESMVEKKYGPPNIHDEMKEEQCIYKNGANFKIKSGFLIKSWTQDVGDATGEVITTTFTDMRLASCPSSLIGGLIDLRTRNFSLRRGNKPTPKPEAF